ncbi:hypothetical protein Ahy_B03g068314 isoform A [Arachis hypogaea]|uniref:Transmembrane protein n=1 Tax=Arachis hypogaea TaxID=3818 RepID=A0A445A9A8_ARAHY|nr:hypothetical protein Ahy_B03g068314 isoform A [Arachis hypogaea]
MARTRKSRPTTQALTLNLSRFRVFVWPSFSFICQNVSVSPSFFESLSISLESHLSHTRRRLVVRLADVSSFVTRPSSSSHSLQSRPWAPRRQRQRQLVGSWLASSLSVGSSSLAVFWFLFVVVAWTVDR